MYSFSRSGKTDLQAWLSSPIKQYQNKDLLLVKLLNTNADTASLMLEELESNTQASLAVQETYINIEKLYYSPQKGVRYPMIS